MKTFPLAQILALFALVHGAAAQDWNFSLFQSPGVDPSPISIAVADVNGDGKPDLISASFDFSTLTVLTNNGNGTFGSNAVYLIDPNEYSGLSSVVAADVNNDGSPDLIAATYDSAFSVAVLTNNGAGVFGLNATYGGDEGVNCAIAADVNGDGSPDLVYVNAWTDTVTVLTNNSHGAFSFSGAYTVGSWPISVAAVDVHGDGVLDLVSVNYGTSIYDGNSLTVLTNDGKGNFGYNATLPVGTRPYYVTAADINGDGALDLICANYDDGTLSVYTNNGSGMFGSNATPNVDGGPFFVTPVEINGSGEVGLVCAIDLGYNRAGELEVFTNDGAGTFNVAGKLPAGDSPSCVVAADFNRDHRPDLVCANYNNPSPTLSVFLNLPQPIINLTSAKSVTVSWPSLSRGWRLQQNTDLTTTNWLDSNFSIFDDGTNKSINTPATGNLFFRLAHP